MKTVYTATIYLEISGDPDRMEPEEIPIDHCDLDDNKVYPLAFTSREELNRHVAAQLIRTIEDLMEQYRDCKLTKIDFRYPESTERLICEAEMTYLDTDRNKQYIYLNVYEEQFKVKE